MLRKKLAMMVITCVFVLGSCTTYFMPVDSFKAQFAGIDSTKLNSIYLQKGTSDLSIRRYSYKANPIKKIKCLDKNGVATELTNSPTIEVRFTYGYKHKRKTLHFQKLFICADSVSFFLYRHHASRFTKRNYIPRLQKVIPLDSITKIELQDVRKSNSLTPVDTSVHFKLF